MNILVEDDPGSATQKYHREVRIGPGESALISSPESNESITVYAVPEPKTSLAVKITAWTFIIGIGLPSFTIVLLLLGLAIVKLMAAFQ